ncbi:MAG TPA: hypothetical protein VFE46_17560 [Pirellulales bacterium]|jgi:hypothetical protein|nr:hypothetical protein [Pirellulales bacterium]
MNTVQVDKIVNAVLYEGYLLYPYRRCVKNEKRMMFGCVYPRDFCENQAAAESFRIQTQCLLEAQGLLEAEKNTQLEVQVRFLQFIERADGNALEAIERKVETDPITAEDLPKQPRRINFTFSGDGTFSSRRENQVTPQPATLQGTLTCSAVQLDDGLFSVTIVIENNSPCGSLPLSSEAAQLFAFVSTHTILQTQGGKFVSAIDPPEPWRELAARQQNQGTWPVLVGQVPDRDTVLCSPIILYDYPQVAAESPGDLFDATEIDEILSLRVMTLSDEEKQQIRNSDHRAQAILARTENLPDDQFRKLHGAIRGLSRLQTTER